MNKATITLFNWDAVCTVCGWTEVGVALTPADANREGSAAVRAHHASAHGHHKLREMKVEGPQQ